jgi:hypothetical protein
MTDRGFYLAMTLLILALAAGEIVYGIFGPLTGRSHRVNEFSSINRTRQAAKPAAMTQGAPRVSLSLNWRLTPAPAETESPGLAGCKDWNLATL